MRNFLYFVLAIWLALIVVGWFLLLFISLGVLFILFPQISAVRESTTYGLRIGDGGSLNV